MSKSRDWAGLSFFLGSVVFVIAAGLAAMVLATGGAAEPAQPATDATAVPDALDDADVTFYVMVYHWDYAIFTGEGARLDTVKVPPGTTLEILAVNALAQAAIDRLPAPVAKAMREAPRPDAEAILAAEPGPQQWPVVDHGLLIEGYGVVEYLAANAQEPKRVVFTADTSGEYKFICTNYCGAGHSYMATPIRLVVQPLASPSPTPTPESAGPQPDDGTDLGQQISTGDVGVVSPLAPLTPTPTPETDEPQSDDGAELGRRIFTGDAGVVSPPCSVCHGVGRAGVGPDLTGVAKRAGTRVEGLTATQYLRQKVLEPRAHLVEGFPAIMPSFQGQMTDDQMKALIAYLMTLE